MAQPNKKQASFFHFHSLWVLTSKKQAVSLQQRILFKKYFK